MTLGVGGGAGRGGAVLGLGRLVSGALFSVLFGMRLRELRRVVGAVVGGGLELGSTRGTKEAREEVSAGSADSLCRNQHKMIAWKPGWFVALA